MGKFKPLKSIIFCTHEEWLAWRRGGVGGSDIPVIRGFGKKSVGQLYMEKITGVNVKLSDFVRKKAEDGEFQARRKISKVLDINDLEPTNVESKRNKRFRASLDGYSASSRVLLEHKCVGSSFYEFFKKHVQAPVFNHEDFVEVMHYDGTDENMRRLRGILEQMCWQKGVLTSMKCKEMYLTVSHLTEDWPLLCCIIPVSGEWQTELRRVWKCQMMAASKFLETVDNQNPWFY